MRLRPYQESGVNRIRKSYTSGKQAPLYVLPTGGGKTYTFSYIAYHAQLKGNRVWIMAHRQELIDQISKSLTNINCKHGIICNGYSPDHLQNVQVCSVQSVANRLEKIPAPNIIITDEAHHSTSSTYTKIYEHFPKARLLGVTATPQRLDGKGLGNIYDDLIMGVSVKFLMDEGFLCPVKYYAPPLQYDLNAVKTTAGDYNKKQLSEAVDKRQIIGDAVKHYKQLANNTQAVAFCVSVAHCEHVQEQFEQAGISCNVINGTLKKTARKKLVQDFTDCKFKILISCEIISEGFDIPRVQTAILLRPTQSLSMHLQQIGRVLRPFEGKDFAIVIDHAGNCLNHGLAEDQREWSLDGRKKRSRKNNTEVITKIKQCTQCYAVHEPSPVCPSCGHVYPIKENTIDEVDGKLQELNAVILKKQRRQEEGMARSLGELVRIGQKRNYKNPTQWAMYKLRARNRKS
jgi:superfamily II DNA or RNA helicase